MAITSATHPRLMNIDEYFDNRKAVPEAIHNKFMNLFRLHIAIGGMPEVVWDFVQTKDMSFIVAMRDYSFKQEIIQNTLKGNTKGGIYECVAADILNKKGYNLFFYRNETTKKELDM